MSTKIPVGQVISDGYNFVFTRFFSILGVVWLPYALFAAITIGLVFLIAPDLPQMLMTHDFDFVTIVSFLRILGLVWLLGLLVTAMVTVGLQRKALGKHPRPVYAYFSLGPPVWRMAAALFLASLVIFVVGLITVFVGQAIWFAAGHIPVAPWIIRIIIVLGLFLFIVYIVARLVFFLPAVVVAEEKIGLERAWILSRGNFWRIVIIWIALVVPTAIVFHVLSWAIFSPSFRGHGWNAPMTSHEIVRQVVMQFRIGGPFLVAIQLLERIVLLGLINGASAHAYLLATAAKPSDMAGPAVPPPAA